MTISTTASSVRVQGNGAQTVFSYGFPIPSGAGYTLYLVDALGNITTLDPSVYSINGIGSANGGSFTYPLAGGTPVAAGNWLVLVRGVPDQQNTALSNQGPYLPQVVELGLDWLEMQIQQNSNELTQTLRAPPADVAMDLLPMAVARANQYLAFDANGQPIVTVGPSTGAAVSAAMTPVVEAATLDAGRVALGAGATGDALFQVATAPIAVSILGLATIAASIAALRIFTSAAEPAGYVNVAGYYAPGDGGGGLYWYDATDSTSTDNGGTILVDASSRRWKLVNFGMSITARQFGAKADYAAVASTGVTIASGSPNLAVAGAAFVAADAGKLISVPGAGASGVTLETTISSVTDTTHVVLAANAGTALTGATKTVSYGTDDAGAIQAAITWAQAKGTALHIGRGLYKTGSVPTIAGRLAVFGDGYGGDAGGIYAGSTAPVLSGSVILPISTVNGLSIATNDAVALRDFQISYTGAPVAGGGVKGIAGTSAGSGANTYSVIRDVCITGADIGVDLLDWYDFDVDHAVVLNAGTTSMHLKVATYPNYSDSAIQGCSFLSGTVTNHLWVESSGGLRIINNKFNYGNGSAGQAIFINPFDYKVGGVSTAFQIEPLLIANNSIEGQIQGVVFERQANSLGGVSALSVTGNEMFVASSSMVFAADGSNEWINGFSITGNTCICNVNSSEVMSLDGCQNGTISANSLTGTGSVTGATGVVLGSHVTNVRQSGTVLSSNVALPVVVTPSMPASGTPIANTNPYPVLVNIYGGTGTQVAINGNVIFSQGATYIFVAEILNPGDTITVTYSSTPPWVWRALNP